MTRKWFLHSQFHEMKGDSDGKSAKRSDADGDTYYYDYSLQLHYRLYLVAFLFADLPSLSPSFHILVPLIVLR